MSIEFVEGLGLVAGAMTTSSFVPQIIRIFKLRSAHEISFQFSALLLAGFLLWIVYGVKDGLLPIVVWNSFNVVFISVVLFAQLRFGRDKKAKHGSTA